jgi:hypothetical protein
MDRQQRLVAEAAIATPRAQTLERIEEEVSRLTGVPAEDVKRIIALLVDAEVLKRCVTPSRNMAEGPRPLDEIVLAWYEKGRLWQPRLAQHADAGPWHYETKFVGGKWEWEIFEAPRGRIASGHAQTLDQAKAAIVGQTGRAPDQWREIGPDLDASA